MTIEAAIIDLQTKLLGIAGLKSAPTSPPEATMSFPFAVSYERSGRLVTHSAYFGDELVTIYCEIHVTRTILPAAISLAMTFRDPFIKAVIADPTLGDNVSTINEIRWTFGALKWDTVDTIGYRFEIDCKIQVSP